MIYRNQWAHALGEEKELGLFIMKYHQDIKKEMALILENEREAGRREKRITEETEALEKEVMSMIEKILLEREAGEKMARLSKEIEHVRDERLHAIALRQRNAAMQFSERKEALEKELKIVQNKSATALRLDYDFARYLERKIKELFKHYVALFDFLQIAIGRIDANFKEESEKLVKFDKRAGLVLRAKSKFIISLQRHIRDGEKLHLVFYENLNDLLNELKRLRDLMEIRLNKINDEFAGLYKKIEVHKVDLEGERKLYEQFREQKKSFGNISKTRIETEEYHASLTEFDEYRIFFSKVLAVLKADDHLLVKNRDRIMAVLGNAYYQLLRQEKMAV